MRWKHPITALNRIPRTGLGIRLGFCLLLTTCVSAQAAVTWLPDHPVHPRALADPREPRVAIAAEFDADRFDGSLGLPIPLLGGNGTWRYAVNLEGAAFFVLGRDGAFYPLRTFDGLFGLSGEVARGAWHGKIRLFHISAHKADGDSTVSYRGSTFSRESAWFEVGRQMDGWFAYVRAGFSWHAVPESPGADFGLGVQWQPPPGVLGPYAAVHLATDEERNWRVNQSILAGLALGNTNRLFLGLRYYNGNSFEGQYYKEPLQLFGFEIQFQPGYLVSATSER